MGTCFIIVAASIIIDAMVILSCLFFHNVNVKLITTLHIILSVVMTVTVIVIVYKLLHMAIALNNK